MRLHLDRFGASMYHKMAHHSTRHLNIQSRRNKINQMGYFFHKTINTIDPMLLKNCIWNFSQHIIYKELCQMNKTKLNTYHLIQQGDTPLGVEDLPEL